jgi:hypothetical protein
MQARFVRLLALAAVSGLTGCAEKEAEWARRGQESLIGLDQSAIRMCAGLPTGTVKDRRGEIWMYEHAASAPGGAPVPSLTIPPGFTIGGQQPNGYCRVQLRGKVTEVQYAGATDLWEKPHAACGPMVRTCLAYAGATR